MNNRIDDVVTATNLRSMAGSRSYSRGEEYFHEGAVHHLYCDGEQLTADVHGTHVYRARITNVGGRLIGKCNCPVGHDGAFCKHLVALGLAYLNSRKETVEEQNKSAFSWNDFLKTRNKDELIKIILEMSPNNSDLIERYRMANLPTDGGAKLRELKSKIDELFGIAEDMEEHYDDYWDGYEDNDSVEEFCEENELLLNVLEQLAVQEEFGLLWDATAYAIGIFMDSSNAEMDYIQEFVGKLAGYFLEALRSKVKPDDEAFRLFIDWEKKGKNFGYEQISMILEGLPAECRDKWAAGALEKWRGYHRRKLSDYDYDGEREYVENHLLAWADERKDFKLKLAIMEKKMHRSDDVVTLAKEYGRQGMQDKVIPFLHKMRKELPRDWEINSLLIEELQKAGDDRQALEIAWEEFTKDPEYDAPLDRLQDVSSRMKLWQEYYRKALDFMEELEKKEKKRPSFPFYYNGMRQRRVNVLFSHGDQQDAWELAQGSMLSEECWLKLAAWRSNEAPDDAAAVVKKLLDDALRPTGEGAYRHVVSLLEIYREYLEMSGRDADFRACCLGIRQEYKRRRLLMEQMDAANL